MCVCEREKRRQCVRKARYVCMRERDLGCVCVNEKGRVCVWGRNLTTRAASAACRDLSVELNWTLFQCGMWVFHLLERMPTSKPVFFFLVVSLRNFHVIWKYHSFVQSWGRKFLLKANSWNDDFPWFSSSSKLSTKALFFCKNTG